MNPLYLRPDDLYVLWVMLTAVLACVACGVLGSFLVLRGMSLFGDAVSHAVLPGLAVAFLMTQSRASAPMFLGAVAVGVLTALLTESLHRWGKVPVDASMGVVFVTLFAIGVLLINFGAAKVVDLDPSCVLYGAIELVPLDTIDLGSSAALAIPHATVTLAVVLVLIVGLIVLFFKELKIASFDPHLATTMGINATGVHYALMAAVAATTVSAFESVGAILVVAMLIAPGATAHLLTDRLDRMLWIAAAVAAVAAVAGTLLAFYLQDVPVAAMLAVAAGAEFALAVVFAPRYGFLSKQLHRLGLSLRIAREDILGMLYRWQEARPDRPLDGHAVRAALAPAGKLVPALALRGLIRCGMVRRDTGERLLLTDAGAANAKTLIRRHRLWETYLAKHLDLPLDHLHVPAHQLEHYVTPQLQETLDSQTAERTDPHGREIPSKTD